MLRATCLKRIEEPTQTVQPVIPGERLKNTNITVLSAEEMDYDPAIEELAMKILADYDILRELIGIMRTAMQKGTRKFYYYMQHKTEKERETICNLIKQMIGIVAEYNYDESCCLLSGGLQMTPRAKDFINGKFMEIAIGALTEKVVNLLAVSRNVDHYKVQRNVIVSDGVHKNEIDLLITLGNEIFFVEIKSGACFRDYERYHTLGLRYGVIPDRILLVNSDITKEEAARIKYFCSYYASSLSTYITTLQTMLLNGMEE